MFFVRNLSKKSLTFISRVLKFKLFEVQIISHMIWFSITTNQSRGSIPTTLYYILKITRQQQAIIVCFMIPWTLRRWEMNLQQWWVEVSDEHYLFKKNFSVLVLRFMTISPKIKYNTIIYKNNNKKYCILSFVLKKVKKKKTICMQECLYILWKILFKNLIDVVFKEFNLQERVLTS